MDLNNNGLVNYKSVIYIFSLRDRYVCNKATKLNIYKLKGYAGGRD